MRPQIREFLSERRLGSVSASGVDLNLDLARALPLELRAALSQEIDALSRHAPEGLLAPRKIVVEDQAVTLEFDPIHAGAVRLSDLLTGLRAANTPIDSGLSAALAATAAQLAHQIHSSTAPQGGPRVHGACSPSTLVLTPSGTVALIGTGLPIIDALLIPEDAPLEARHTAPEQAAGAPLVPRSDIFSLGVLYLTLLAGRTPWPGISPEEHLATLAAGRLTNPGVSIPNPRPPLVDVLRRAMSPDISARYGSALEFGQAISNELKASGEPRRGADALRALFDTPIPKGAPKGPEILALPPSGKRPVVVPSDTPTRPAPPAHRTLVEASATANEGGGDWSAIFEGEALPQERRTP